MKLAYVIGPYRSKHEFTVFQNIINAREVSLCLWRLGYATICPHMNSAFFGGACHDEVWLNGDIEFLRRMNDDDIAVTVNGWENSSGSRDEVRFCREKNKPMLYHSMSGYFTSIDELISDERYLIMKQIK